MRRAIRPTVDLHLYRAVVGPAGEAAHAPHERAAQSLEPLDRHPVVPVVGRLVPDALADRPVVRRGLCGSRRQRVHPPGLGQYRGTANDHLGRDAAVVRTLAADQMAVDAEHRPAGLGHALGHFFTAGAQAEHDHVVRLQRGRRHERHRTGRMGPVSTNEPLTSTDQAVSLYEAVGGEETFRRLVDTFYAGVAADPVLRALYPEDDLGPAAERLRMFLIQYWGGPTTYSERRGHPRLRMRHAPFAIGVAAHDAWLRHMRASLDSLALAPEYDEALWQYFTMAADSLRNVPG